MIQNRLHSTQADDVEVLCLVKGPERYLFVFTDENATGVLRTIGRYASDPDLSLTWQDAAELAGKVRQR